MKLQTQHILGMISWLYPSFHGNDFLDLWNRFQPNHWSESQIEELIEEKYPQITNKKIDQLRFYREGSENLIQKGVQFVTPIDKNYPQILLNSSRPPALLTYLGAPVWNKKKGISVVGSRKISDLSRLWIRTRFMEFIESQDIYTVSGGALGVDMACHLASINAHCSTVVVLPTGLTNIYPRELVSYKEAILQSGGVFLSPFAPHQNVRKSLFPMRNRIIVSLSHLLILIQAARRSGSYMSARLALEEGRSVGVVPGHPLMSDFQGCLDLLFDGASLIRDEVDLRYLLQQ